MDTYAHLVSGTRDVAVNRVAEIVIRAPELEPAKEANESGSKMAATSMSSSNESPKNAANSMTESGSPGRSLILPNLGGSCLKHLVTGLRYPHGYPQLHPKLRRDQVCFRQSDDFLRAQLADALK